MRAFERCLVYLAAADDPAITILPTHRLVRPGPGIAFSLDDLWARLDDAYDTEPADDARVGAGHRGLAARHAPRVRGGRPRRRRGAAPSPAHRALHPATGSMSPCSNARCWVPPASLAEAIEGGALAYTRDPAGLEAAVRSGEAVLGFGVTPVTAGAR